MKTLPKAKIVDIGIDLDALQSHLMRLKKEVMDLGYKDTAEALDWALEEFKRERLSFKSDAGDE